MYYCNIGQEEGYVSVDMISPSSCSTASTKAGKLLSLKQRRIRVLSCSMGTLEVLRVFEMVLDLPTSYKEKCLKIVLNIQ